MATLIVFIVADSRLHFLIGNSFTHRRFWPYLMTHLLFHLATFAGFLIGGLSRSAANLARRGRPLKAG